MNFAEAVSIVIDLEGGYVNDPDDPGGETKYGISKRSYPELDIKNLSLADAEEIYFHDYWLKNNVDKLPDTIRLMYFDACVNQGPGGALKCLQYAVGSSEIGGKLFLKAGAYGPLLLERFLAERALRYSLNPRFTKYGKGWFRRLAHIALATGKSQK